MRATLAALALICATAPAVAQERSIIIGKVESARMLALLQDVMPQNPDALWHGEVYELKLDVVEVLSGDDPGEQVTVKVTAHARQFVGMTIVVVIDPDLKKFVPGQSWWASIRELACLPNDLLKADEFQEFVRHSSEMDDERCLGL